MHAFLKPIANQPHFTWWKRQSKQSGKRSFFKRPMANVNTDEGWTSYAEALAAVRERRASCEKQGVEFVGGVGVRLTRLPGLVCVDLDHVRPDGKLLPEWRKLIKRANTFTEISVSGAGAHLWFRLDAPRELHATIDNPDGTRTEFFSGTNRYICLGRRPLTAPLELRTITLAELTRLFPGLAVKLAPKARRPVAMVQRKTSLTSAQIARSCRSIASRSAPDGRNSHAFFGQVRDMQERGATPAQMLTAFEAAPRGAACERYRDEGRLEDQIDACLDAQK